MRINTLVKLKPTTTPLQPLYLLTFVPRYVVNDAGIFERLWSLPKTQFFVLLEQMDKNYIVVRLKYPVTWNLLPSNPADFKFKLLRMQTPITELAGRIIGPDDNDKTLEHIVYGECTKCELYLYY